MKTHKRWKPVSVRPTPTQLERWRRCAAHYPKLSFSEFLRRAIDDVVTVDENARSADRVADRRAEQLGRLTPEELRRRRRKGLHDYPELDEPEASA